MKCEFKSAKELGLPPKQWEALIKALLLMEADAIAHAPKGSLRWTPDKKAAKHIKVFSMDSWNDVYSCGTACCIGGSAELFGRLRSRSLSATAERLMQKGNDQLYNLFFEWEGPEDQDDPTPQQAAKVLRHYLKTGTTKWGLAYK